MPESLSERPPVPQAPKDEVALEGNMFVGKGYVLVRDDAGQLTIVEVPFNIPIGEPLRPFIYHKPVENPADPFARPVEIRPDKEPRTGYRPLAVINNALRAPNHLYREGDAFFAAVERQTETGPVWESRFFPRSSVEPSIWNEAVRIVTRAPKTTS